MGSGRFEVCSAARRLPEQWGLEGGLLQVLRGAGKDLYACWSGNDSNERTVAIDWQKPTSNQGDLGVAAQGHTYSRPSPCPPPLWGSMKH